MGAQDVVPSIGVITAALLAVPALNTTYKVTKRGYLGEVNPIPFAVLWVNAFCWIVYAVFLKNQFLIWPNLFGFLSMTYCWTTCLPMCTARQQKIIRAIVWFGALIFGTNAITAAHKSPEAADSSLGVACMLILIIFYASPLTSLAQVCRTRNSESILFPLSFCISLNGALWMFYGIANHNVNIALPNGLGFAMGVLQMLCVVIFPPRRFCFPSTDEKRVDVNDEANGKPSDKKEGEEKHTHKHTFDNDNEVKKHTNGDGDTATANHSRVNTDDHII